MDRSDAQSQDVNLQEGLKAGYPKFESVAGDPFMQLARLCPAEADDGLRFLDQLLQNH